MNNHVLNIIELFQDELGVNNPSEAAIQNARDLILKFIKEKNVMLRAFVAAKGGKTRGRKKKDDIKN